MRVRGDRALSRHPVLSLFVAIDVTVCLTPDSSLKLSQEWELIFKNINI